MTEILFYHLQGMSLESVLPPLLEKSLERGICGPTATIRSCRTPHGVPAMRRTSPSFSRSRTATRTGPMSGS
jgi:hypothetical protein